MAEGSLQVVSSPQNLPKILVVDDDALVLKSLVRVLASQGVEVIAMDDPYKAMKLVTEKDLAGVLCDIQMPQMTGLAFARFVRSQQPDVPVMLMTGDPNIQSALEAFDVGIVEYLPKPIDALKLRSAVQRAVKLSKLAQAQRQAEALTDSIPPTSRADLLGGALDRALATLSVAFQPIVAPSRRSIFGYEALLRSQEPELPTPPAVIAAGRTHEVGRAVRALSVRAFLDAPPDAMLFLNILPMDLVDDELYDKDSKLCGLASRIVLEMTERADLAKVRDAMPRVQRLRDLGYRIAIDDLGAGYAGLSSFTALEPEFTKLDMSLIRGLHVSAVKQRVVGSIVSLCKDLGSRVVAEGIETPEDRDALMNLGCEFMQGYYFARPAPPFPDVRW